MTVGSDTYFVKLKSDEIESKLRQLARLHEIEIQVWIKGESKKTIFFCKSFEINTFQLNLISNESYKHLLNKNILYSFQLGPLLFFGRSKLETNGAGLFLNCKDDLYRRERRKNFRLLTYPVYKIFARFYDDTKYEGENVINFKTRMSQTGLFKNFLKIIGGGYDDVALGEFKQRVIDISVTGMSFLIGEVEKDFFVQDAHYEDIRVEFMDETIEIPRGKIIYIIDSVLGNKNNRLYKVGFEFLDIEMNIDLALGKKINSILKKFESDDDEFEKNID
jgi:hypothetical protein